MKRKGFTLVELLGVIVVLAVIAIITTPVILGVIEKSKKESYRNSIYGIIESANIYLANHLTSIGRTKEIAFTCNGINCSNEEGDSLDFKGTVPKSGTFYLNGAEDFSWSIHKSGNKIQLFVSFKVNNAISAGSSLFALDSDCAPSTSYFFGIIRTDASGSRMGNVNQNESVVRTVDILNAGYYMIDTVIYQ